MRLTQVKNLKTVDALRSHLDSLGVSLPLDDEVDAGGVLSTPIDTGVGVAANRFAILPMEGWDGTEDGAVTDLVRRRWSRFGASGAGLVWGEATAVRRDGRANANQLVIDHVAGLRELLDPAQVCGLQLTHSGRWSKPTPRTAHVHPELDRRLGTGPDDVFTDDELDELADQYVRAAVLAHEAGFDFVDVKHCHGYLLHELLGARNRPAGRYADDRTLFLRTVVDGVRGKAPDLGIAVRLSAFDVVPFTKGDDGVGVPVVGDHPAPYSLDEAHGFLDVCESLGIRLVSITGGSPYYCPHVQRPAYFPPSDGYTPPEDPLVGVARQVSAVTELAARHPSLVLVASALSYLQQWLPNVAQALVRDHGVAFAGLGRMALSYPDLPHDVLAGRPLDARMICRTFSDCTTAPRNGLVSGCFPLDPFYKEHPQRVQLAAIKRATKTS
ncbi:MAG TPA: NADH:flavin oxidoreductase [Acidimicrobiales bacterium]|nr:NADH:flavin oxidoreductase [Acidimicrobiales bacterium]